MLLYIIYKLCTIPDSHDQLSWDRNTFLYLVAL